MTDEDVRLWRRYHHAHREAKTKLEAGGSEDSDTEERAERNVLLEAADTHLASADMASTTGYEGSEDESTAETVTEVKIRLIPLASVCVTQPCMSVSLSSAHQRMEVSMYNMAVALKICPILQNSLILLASSLLRVVLLLVLTLLKS